MTDEEKLYLQAQRLFSAVDALEQSAGAITAEFESITSRIRELEAQIALIQAMYDDVQDILKK